MLNSISCHSWRAKPDACDSRQSRFLFSATVKLFEQHGFAQEREVGKHAWIVSRDIDPAQGL
jgi:hypothetical protein